ncbi:MAG: polysaccharide biosynthesis tyrosine autokinase [Cyanobacteria bacterium J06621_8]
MLSNNSKKQSAKNPSTSGAASREALDVNMAEYLIKVKRRWKPALVIFLLTLGVTGALSLLQKKTYVAEGKLLFKKDATPIKALEGQVNALEPLISNQTPVSTQIQILESEPVVQQVIDRQKLTNDEGEPIKPEDFKRNLRTEIIGGTDVVQISYQHPNPDQAAEIVNTMMDTYVQEQIRGNQSKPQAAREFLDRELPSVESRVQDAEAEISAFRAENNIIDLAEEKKGLVASLGTLNQQISTTGSELRGTQAQAAALQGQLGLNLEQAVKANQLGSYPEVQSILEQLAQTETDLAQERQRFNEKHPSIISLREKKQNLNQQLRGLIVANIGEGVNVSQGLLQNNNGNKENQLEKFITIKIDELSLQRQVASLYQTQQTYLQRAKDLPRLEKKDRQLVRAAEAAGQTYETLLNSLQQAQLAENNLTGNADIVEYAAVPETGSSGRTLLLGMGLVCGAFLANLSVILLEMQDRSLKSLADIKKSFPYQTVGITPLEPPSYQGRIITRDEPDSFSSEVYRMIQTNLKFLTSEKPPKVILVTSSVPEEGKSTVVANLGAAIAQLGRNILLIDADLRRSSQHELWGVENSQGLKDIIANQAPPKSVVQQPMAKLNLLTSGRVQSNPLALLDTDAMSDFIGRSRREYDLILIDAPPLPVTADVLTLSKLVDGILFVTRPGVVEQESAELAQETLATTGQKVLGMVINGVKSEDFERYSYHGRYGKSYFKKGNAAPQSKSNFDNSKRLSDIAETSSSNGSVPKAKL